MADRSSEADEPELITDPEERARVEAENSLAQFDAAMVELKKWLRTADRRLRPSEISTLHRVLMDRLSEYAGIYRPAKIKIKGSHHIPPPANEVAGLMEDLCDYLAKNWDSKTSTHLAAYVLWRINWIHPFSDGNGRTARVVSYLILCAHSGKELPGDLTIPEQIARNKKPYYKALEAADFELKKGQIELSELEKLLKSLLANQLYDFYQKASGDAASLDDVPKQELNEVLEEARREGIEDRKAVFARSESERWGLFSWFEKHPAITSVVGAILVVIVTWLLSKFG
jgi:Fic family protein